MKGKRAGMKSKQRYHGIKYIKETNNIGAFTMVAGQPYTALKYVCNFADISNSASWQGVSPLAALKAIYGRYCITGVKYTFIPLSTQSVAGQKNVDRVCFARNKDPQDTLTDETDIIRQDDCKFTNTARKFSVYIKHPTPVLSQTAIQTSIHGLAPHQYPNPTGGANNPNQVAVSYNAMKWTWLPTRVETGEQPPFSKQYPDHVGLDVVITSQNGVPTADYDVYTVYQTLYLAFKEQD